MQLSVLRAWYLDTAAFTGPEGSGLGVKQQKEK